MGPRQRELQANVDPPGVPDLLRDPEWTCAAPHDPYDPV